MKTLRQVGHTEPLAVQSEEILTIDTGGRSPEPDTPRAGVFEASPDALANDVALKLGHDPDDGEHGLPDRRSGVELFLQRDELHMTCAEALEGGDHVLDRSSEAIEAPHEDSPEASSPRRLHQAVKGWAALFCPGNATVDEFLDHLPSAMGRVGSKRTELHLGVLIWGAH